MALTDLFKSTAEIEREKEKKRRKAIRDAEHAVDAVKDKIKDLKQNRDKAWEDARNYLRDGQKAAAQRCLQTVQATEIMMGKLEKKNWVFNQYITKMDLARTDQDFAGALQNLNNVLNINPEQISEILGNADDTLEDQVDVDKIWDKKYQKEMDGITGTDTIPTVEEMMSQLEIETFPDKLGANISQNSTSHTTSLTEEIGAGRKKLQDLLNNKK